MLCPLVLVQIATADIENQSSEESGTGFGDNYISDTATCNHWHNKAQCHMATLWRKGSSCSLPCRQFLGLKRPTGAVTKIEDRTISC